MSRINRGKTIEENVFIIPFSYEKIINYKKNIDNRFIEKILSEFPGNIYLEKIETETILNEKEVYKKEVYKKEVYNSISKNGNDVVTEIMDLYNITTIHDRNGIEKIKTQKTNILCGWCCHKFNNYPICVPDYYNVKTGLFRVSGCFCSFNCGLSYMKQNKHRYRDTSLINFMKSVLTGSFTKIKCAPPKEILEAFGGPINIEEYRKEFDTLVEYRLNYYPMYFKAFQMEKIIEMTVHRDSNKISQIKPVILSESKISKSIDRDSKKTIGESNLIKFLKKKKTN
jgi:hypothetical protein